MMTENKKAIVTGGAGFIGSHIVDVLIDGGFEVYVLDNFAAGRREDRINPKATYHEVDIRDFDSIAPLIAGARYVFHEAALPRVQFSIQHPLETLAVNVTGAANVLRAAHVGGVERVICASSGSVYGDQETMPFSENLAPLPKSPYGLHKYTLELLCKMWSEVYGLPTVSLRYFNIYGPRMDPEGAYALAIAKFLKQRQEGKPMTIWGDGSHSRDFTHVRDAVRANLLAAESKKVGKGEAINIGAGRNVSVSEVAAMIGGPVIYELERLEPKHALADNMKARQLLNWEPVVSVEEGIAELKLLQKLA